jgi:hypothetical protein
MRLYKHQDRQWVTTFLLPKTAISSINSPCLAAPVPVPLVLCRVQPWGQSVFLRLQKRQDRQWTKQEQANKMVKWNESCWKGTVYIIFSATAFLVTFREKYFMDPYHYWTGATGQYSAIRHSAVHHSAVQLQYMSASAAYDSTVQYSTGLEAKVEGHSIPSIGKRSQGLIHGVMLLVCPVPWVMCAGVAGNSGSQSCWAVPGLHTHVRKCTHLQQDHPSLTC